MSRTRVRDNPIVRRAQILDEGIGLVGERGFYGLTVQALAKRCQISNAGLLHYFPSKEEILLAILTELERRETEIVGLLVAQARECAPGAMRRSALSHLLEVIVGRVMTQGDVGRALLVLQAEALDASHPAHDWFVERERLTLELIAELAADLPAPFSTARQAYALFNGLAMQWMRAGGKFDLMGEWDVASRMLLGTARRGTDGGG